MTELPEKLSRLNPEKPREVRPYLQYQSNPPPLAVPTGYASTGPIMRPPPQSYISQPLQYPYEQGAFQASSTYVVGGSNVNRSISQTSNNPSPSIITFQKDVRSTLDHPSVSQMRANNINLQQIDEQLQMSRKLFPS